MAKVYLKNISGRELNVYGYGSGCIRQPDEVWEIDLHLIDHWLNRYPDCFEVLDSSIGQAALAAAQARSAKVAVERKKEAIAKDQDELARLEKEREIAAARAEAEKKAQEAAVRRPVK